MIKRTKSWLRAFFGVSTHEATGLLILLPLLCGSLLVVPAYHAWRSKGTNQFVTEQKTLDSLLAHWPAVIDSTAPPKLPARFPFNPNTITLSEMDSLGIPVAVARRIEAYRANNGKFAIKSDFKKIYGLDSSLYKSLYDFILLPDARVSSYSQLQPATNLKTVEPADINTADTTQLKKIYGIGSKLSARIVNYRSRLGGFVSMTQLNEVYGLNPELVNRIAEKFTINPAFEPVKINLNRASEQELRQHPYISGSLAKAIATYRFQHGDFQHPEGLLKIVVADSSFYKKIIPYLSLKP
ncbi:MAG: helix-hairpin-helix domain-containing protein [Cyclobacteriaceae bacterium]|nr:helix-hairpin-helix domain-containing protein [Cyclobacteriaceae bacterium]